MTYANRSILGVCLATLAAAAGMAAAQPVEPGGRTGGLLAGDQTLDAVLLTRDLDGDGDAGDAGEAWTWADATNASGMGTGDVFSIFQSATGWVYFSDGSTDAVYRARDTSGDGDANDAGEGAVWFSGAGNAPGYTLATPNGLWEPAPGVVFVLNAGAGDLPEDAIYRTEDLNADGDAEDAGEAALWMDLLGLIEGSSAFDVAFIGETAYFADLRGGDVDAIIRAADSDGSGTVESGEWSVFIDADNPWGAPIGFAVETDGRSVYVADNLSGNAQTVYRLTDLDASGAIDSAAEAVLVWDESRLPDGRELGSVFTLALGTPGVLALGSSGGDDEDAVYVLTDGDGDGLFLGAGETAMWLGGAASGGPASRVRSLEYATGAACAPDFNGDGLVDTRDVIAFLNAWSAGDQSADFNGDGVIDTRDVIAFLNAWTAGC
ncbi:MAG TPA: GC-type dockerin domain-anchored protein [Phycisphaerales bacterium]|nr:GC-type dockerin domain-anchored protein [Phycisphaerales bacterium]